MFTKKEHNILNALIEDELSTTSRLAVDSEGDNPIIWSYIDTLKDIRRKFTKTFEKDAVIK
jgi:hypothetical protein